MKSATFLRLVVWALFFLNCISINAQQIENTRQVLVPKEVFVGDSAHIIYSFRSPADFFDCVPSSRIKNDSLILSPALPAFTSVANRCTISEATISRNGLNYVLDITIIPWEPGTIQIPPFDLYAACRFLPTESDSPETSQQQPLPTCTILLEPINIASLAERLGASQLRPPAAPLMLPGTKYIVWSLIVIVIAMLLGLGFLVVHFSLFIKKIRTLRNTLSRQWNVRLTKHRLRLLLTKQTTDKEFAARWQQTMRTYLTNRFCASYQSVAVKHLVTFTNELTGNMLSSFQENAAIQVYSLFVRTDYIRYAQGSLDSRQIPQSKHEACFAEDERQQVVDQTIQCVADFERSDEPKETMHD
ncbi:MAG: hypothetical protein J1D88_00845 [Treponema sp.]|nr:hypothetical protein [Treponema sp.]